MRIFYLLIVCVPLFMLDSTPPVGFTFMIADLKHNEEEGIKICELQSGTFSAFRGYDWLAGEPGLVPKRVIQMLSQFNHKLFVDPYTIEESAIRQEMKNEHIPMIRKYTDLIKSKSFLELAELPVENPYDLSSYHVLLIAKKSYFKKQLESFREKFPNVLILDVDCFPWWRNKHKMTTLFQDSPELEALKPKWKLVEKTMSQAELAKSSQWFEADYVVIKPLSSLLGKGVIVLKRSELPKILTLICKEKSKLKDHQDKTYHYWATHQSNELIIEEFHYSDPVYVEHLDNKPYDGTLRIAFMLWLHKGEIHMDFVEAHWKLPYKSLIEEGTFMQLHKSYDHVPHFACIDQERLENIQDTLRKTMPMIYLKMLEGIQESLSATPDERRQ